MSKKHKHDQKKDEKPKKMSRKAYESELARLEIEF